MFKEKEAEQMANKKMIPGFGGNRYVPYEERTGNESVVYFTRDLSLRQRQHYRQGGGQAAHRRKERV